MDFCVLLKFDKPDMSCDLVLFVLENNTSDGLTQGGHKEGTSVFSLDIRNALGSLSALAVCQKRLIYVFISLFFNST